MSEIIDDVSSAPEEAILRGVTPYKLIEREAYHTKNFLSIVQNLEQFHSVFSRVWVMGHPRFCNNIPTAAVSFNKEGEYLDFRFNPDFWATCDEYNLTFIVAHEALHVMLNHGARGRGLFPKIANVAMDIVINEMLRKHFGFNRTQIDNWQAACWYDTVLDANGITNYRKDECFEYYYELILDNAIETGKFRLIDGHDELPELSKVERDKIANKINNEVSKEELSDVEKKMGGDIPTDQDYKDYKDLKKPANEGKKPDKFKESGFDPTPGTVAGELVRLIKLPVIIRKEKWETVIKEWWQKALYEKEVTQWAIKGRRYALIQNKGIYLPFDRVQEFEDRRKIDVSLFLDTSGSCTHLADRFWKAGASIPKDRFNVKMYCFDTKVYPTTLASRKSYGGGGTAFDIIESYIQAEIKQHQRGYPKAIFVVTDGAGNMVNPEKPKRWFWFLSEDYRRCIPKDSHIYDLSEFE